MKLIRNLFTLSLVFSFLVPIQAQKLDRSERKIIERVSANNDEAIDFLEKVVNINSGSLNLEGILKPLEINKGLRPYINLLMKILRVIEFYPL